MTNALLLRRRGMMTAQQGGLPYDAEIEYLETDGNQYINTGVQCNDGLVFFADFLYKSYFSIYNYIAGAGTSSSNRIYFTRLHNTNHTLRLTYNTSGEGSWTGFALNSRHEVLSEAVKDAQKLYVDGTLRYSSSINTSVSAGSIYIFCSNYNGTPSSICSARMWSCKITRKSDDVILFDAIPVRVGQVGYLYDRVSGQLFGNAGTGDFVLGPDVQ